MWIMYIHAICNVSFKYLGTCCASIHVDWVTKHPSFFLEIATKQNARFPTAYPSIHLSTSLRQRLRAPVPPKQIHPQIHLNPPVAYLLNPLSDYLQRPSPTCFHTQRHPCVYHRLFLEPADKTRRDQKTLGRPTWVNHGEYPTSPHPGLQCRMHARIANMANGCYSIGDVQAGACGVAQQPSAAQYNQGRTMRYWVRQNRTKRFLKKIIINPTPKNTIAKPANHPCLSIFITPPPPQKHHLILLPPTSSSFVVVFLFLFLFTWPSHS